METVFSTNVNLERIRQLCTHVFLADGDINIDCFDKGLINAEFFTEGFEVTETEADIFFDIVSKITLHTWEGRNSILSFIIPIGNFQIAKLGRGKRSSGVYGNLIRKFDVTSLSSENKNAFHQVAFKAGFDKGVDRQQFRIHFF